MPVSRSLEIMLDVHDTVKRVHEDVSVLLRQHKTINEMLSGILELLRQSGQEFDSQIALASGVPVAGFDDNLERFRSKAEKILGVPVSFVKKAKYTYVMMDNRDYLCAIDLAGNIYCVRSRHHRAIRNSMVVGNIHDDWNGVRRLSKKGFRIESRAYFGDDAPRRVVPVRALEKQAGITASGE